MTEIEHYMKQVSELKEIARTLRDHTPRWSGYCKVCNENWPCPDYHRAAEAVGE